jgi:hypothetical protein
VLNDAKFLENGGAGMDKVREQEKLDPEKYFKMRQNPQRQVHAVLSALHSDTFLLVFWLMQQDVHDKSIQGLFRKMFAFPYYELTIR